MEDKIVTCAVAIVDAYSRNDDAAMKSHCWTMNQMIQKRPTLLCRTEKPYIISVALYYGLKAGYCFGERIMHAAYYCMLKAYRQGNAHDSVAVSMYGFVFLDSNIGILLPTLFARKLKGANVSIALGVALGQLTIFYWKFKDAGERVDLDIQTMKLLDIRIKMYASFLKFEHDDKEEFSQGIFSLTSNILAALDEEWEQKEEEQIACFENEILDMLF